MSSRDANSLYFLVISSIADLSRRLQSGFHGCKKPHNLYIASVALTG